MLGGKENYKLTYRGGIEFILFICVSLISSYELIQTLFRLERNFEQDVSIGRKFYPQMLASGFLRIIYSVSWFEVKLHHHFGVLSDHCPLAYVISFLSIIKFSFEFFLIPQHQN
jgi:hypothetical protein